MPGAPETLACCRWPNQWSSVVQHSRSICWGVLQAGGQHVRQLAPQAGPCLCFPLHMRVDVLPSQGSLSGAI